MSDLSQTDAEFDRGDSFSSTSTGVEVPTDNEGLPPFMFEPKYGRDEAELWNWRAVGIFLSKWLHFVERKKFFILH